MTKLTLSSAKKTITIKLCHFESDYAKTSAEKKNKETNLSMIIYHIFSEIVPETINQN